MIRFGLLTLSAALLLVGCGEPGRRAGTADEAAQPDRETVVAPQAGPTADQPATTLRRAAVEHAHANQTRPNPAVAVLLPVGDSGVAGVVRFIPQGEVIHVRGRVTGLTPGKHGFHVHQYGDLTDQEKGESAGGHFDPHEMPHGRPGDEQRHAGDFGNIEANEQGVAEIDFEDAVIRLHGPDSIIGRSLVVHRDEDRFTQPTGDAGPRVAFGVIGVSAAERQ